MENSTFFNSTTYQQHDPNIQDILQGLYICPMAFFLSFVFLADKMKVPNQLLAMIYGSMIGLAYYYIPLLEGQIVFFWKPDNIIVLCHPIMLIKVAFSVDVYAFAQSKWQILIVATLGTGMFICLFGFLVMVMNNREVNLVNIIAAGTTLASIDVPDVLMELNRIKNLEVVMDGESVFGAALCIMTYNFCVGFYTHIVTEWYHVVCLYLRHIILAIIMGHLIGKMAAFSFKLFYQDAYNATMMLLASCYGAYYLCEQYLFCSATICTVFVAHYMAKARSRLSPNTDAKVQIVVDNAYNVVEFINCIALSAIVTFGMVKMYKNFDFAVALGVYIMGNVLRILIFLILYPILTRLGLGFNITTLLTISWAAKRGSLQLLQVVFIFYYGITEILGTELLCFTVVYLTLSFLINMTSLGYLLKYFGLIEFTMARKYNITHCISMLMTKRQRLMFAQKTNRLLSDLNWELIRKLTELNNPYAAISGDLERANEFETVCPLCSKNIPYLSSAQEQHEFINDVRSNILKRQRITLVRLSELNLIRKKEFDIIIQYIELALNSAELKVPYKHFLELFNIDKVYVRWQKRINRNKIDVGSMIWRRWAVYSFLRVFTHRWFLYLKITISVLITILILIWIFLVAFHISFAHYLLWAGYGLELFFIFEILINIASFKCESVYQMYFKICWNFYGIFLLLLGITSFIASVMFGFHYIRITCLLRVLSYEQMGIYFLPFLNSMLIRKIDRQLATAYCFGLAIVTSLEEVQSNLHSICKIPHVYDFIARQVQNDKMCFMEMLAFVQYTKPHVAVATSTFQLKMSVLKEMYTTAQEIFDVGAIEEFEYHILRNIIEKTTRKVRPTTAIQLNSAKTMLREIPWIGADDDMFEYLCSNIMLRIWESGEAICEKGDFIDGIVVITQGLLKMTYEPDEDMLFNLERFGMLPIKERLASTNFKEPEEEYLFMGNTIGELSFLTGRPYDCRIEAVRSTSGLVITKNVLLEASDFNTDPIFGLICRMWKHVTSTITWRILMEKAHYHNISITYLHSVMNRAFIPNISHYQVLQVSNYIDDIIIIDGMVVDYNTKKQYMAPCCIPRLVHQLQVLPQNTNAIYVKPTIVVIPRIMIDSYTVMETTEDISQIKKGAQSTAPVRNVAIRKIKRECAIEMIRDREKLSEVGKTDEEERMHRNSINETKMTSILDYLSQKF